MTLRTRLAYWLLGVDEQRISQHEARIERELSQLRREDESDAAMVAQREFDRLLQEFDRR